MSLNRLEGKRCVITGGTAGIGWVTARRLVELGALVTIVGSNVERGQVAIASIKQATGVDQAEFLQADLSDQEQIRQLAETLLSRYPAINVLINNAGAMFKHRQTSVQGLEMTFALNHLSYFMLTLLCLSALKKAAPSRIVNVSSAAHRPIQLDFGDLQAKRNYRGLLTYRRSKLANLLFTFELARRLDPRIVTVNALHPGFVATDIGVRHGLLPSFLWKLATQIGAITPEEGAKTSVYLAASPEVAGVHGQYFAQCKPAQPSSTALDPQIAAQLWEESLRLTGLSSLVVEEACNAK
jgi:NAD(P)-dependent dehydrogenase (short-subunit alcohol dehydrogenase family)